MPFTAVQLALGAAAGLAAYQAASKQADADNYAATLQANYQMELMAKIEKEVKPVENCRNCGAGELIYKAGRPVCAYCNTNQ